MERNKKKQTIIILIASVVVGLSALFFAAIFRSCSYGIREPIAVFEFEYSFNAYGFPGDNEYPPYVDIDKCTERGECETYLSLANVNHIFEMKQLGPDSIFIELGLYYSKNTFWDSLVRDTIVVCILQSEKKIIEFFPHIKYSFPKH